MKGQNSEILLQKFSNMEGKMETETKCCDALKFAIEFEKKGEQFYRDSAVKVGSSFAKKTLKFLTDEELKHIEKIEKFNKALLDKNDFDLEAECQSDLPEKIKGHLDQFAKKKIEKIAPQSTDIDIYSIGIDMEKSGYKIYKEAFEKNTDERLKSFFKFLMEEESAHYDLLAASKKYLEDSSYYFEDLGGWIFG